MATQRFLQLAEVSEVLNISSAQAYALARSGDLPAIKICGRGQWSVERADGLGKQLHPPMARQVRTLMTRHQGAGLAFVPTTSKVAL